MFASPAVFSLLDAVFGRANKTAFNIEKCFQNGFGVVDRNTGSKAHQKRQEFDAAFPIVIKNFL